MASVTFGICAKAKPVDSARAASDGNETANKAFAHGYSSFLGTAFDCGRYRRATIGQGKDAA